MIELTDGSITEDSDVWLFGAKRVYKNFFSSDQYIEFYSDNVIKTQLGMDRHSLINIALLVGSDYTTGIENVGIVKAVEILNEFEGNGLEKLINFKWFQLLNTQFFKFCFYLNFFFRKWHSTFNPNSKNLTKLQKALCKLKLDDNFPSEIVYNAYLNPEIETNIQELKWSLPELDSIRK